MSAAPHSSGAQRAGSSTRDRLKNAVASGGRTAAVPENRRRRTPKPAAPNDLGADTRPALERRSTGKQQQGINFDTALLEYMREAVAYMGRRHPEEAGSESLAALIDQAVREKLDRWERKHNDGNALPSL
ncbi:hypothetical protein [Nocardia flavorosea]|uniref:Centromere-binding protein ParB C-terminal domain-containing protein n=1 Tax=Nocardia flavorosea TaxID=53429 RepID=A0A846YUS9_9NOCA|nr:hypothetical protein [Nocardia flavorosea]NKY61002.1 hypothetical protein [Nocardia flavorosea]